jgi:hypothetical protein
MIRTLELTDWGFDAYEFRPVEIIQSTYLHAHSNADKDPGSCLDSPICPEETHLLQFEFDKQRSRADLLAEMDGLEWSIAVVDLRKLLAFQRRLSFRPGRNQQPDVANDWPSLMDVAFSAQRTPVYESVYYAASNTLHLHSDDPNLHLRTTANPTTPFAVHSGGPFFEVALYNGRWFLRDGYHRAYALLNAGIERIPSLIVYARSLSELGADRPWFFPESVLFSSRPPRVTDFLNPHLTVEYGRPRTRKTIRITVKESLFIAPSGEST